MPLALLELLWNGACLCALVGACGGSGGKAEKGRLLWLLVLVLACERVTAFCAQRSDATCFGEERSFALVTGAADPFDGLDLAGVSASKPAFADVNGDGLVDMLLGTKSGKVLFFKNTGNTTMPHYEAVTDTTQNPFDNVRVPSNRSAATALLPSLTAAS